MNDGLLHKIGLICSRNFTIQRINRLFTAAVGAEQNWHIDEKTRQGNVEKWIEEIKKHMPSRLEEIIKNVILRLLQEEQISEQDKSELKQLRDENPELAKPVATQEIMIPSDINELLNTIIKGIPRAVFPLKNRRKNSNCLKFEDEYDFQSLFHSLIAPWVSDIRPEEYTPSYAGTSTKIDFVLPKHDTVIELKYIRDIYHAKKVGEELIVDIAHYRTHPTAKNLWIVIADLNNLIPNPESLKSDLNGKQTSEQGTINVETTVLSLNKKV